MDDQTILNWSDSSTDKSSGDVIINPQDGERRPKYFRCFKFSITGFYVENKARDGWEKNHHSDER